VLSVFAVHDMAAQGSAMTVHHPTLLFLIALVLAAGCGGGSRRLEDGQWYGKLVTVNVAQRKVTFAPACRFKAPRWSAVPTRGRVRFTVSLAPDPDLAIYVRPSGSAGAGHGQPTNLAQLADVVLHGHLPDSPPGWFVTARDGTAVSVHEDSGTRSTGSRDRRTFACVWRRSTQRFVSK
jgi:hypothetical protein